MHPAVRLTLIVVAGVALLLGVIWLGNRAHRELTDRDHYSLVVADLPLTPPAGLSKAEFLAEVQYLSGLPAKLDRTAADSRERLRVAFATHPWVAAVEVGADLQVKLTLRVPALAVNERVLDTTGVLLPLRTDGSKLPKYVGAKKPFAASGRLYEDAVVVAVARTVAFLRQQAPAMEWERVEMTPDGLILTRSDGATANWGHGKAGEPAVDQKLAKLREWKTGAIDLR